ncbi:EamA family transporter [Corynebacterium caspium]|uniref:EamA family transporter n=1 Tax=Corynebacterium caspium TaxID=234828 RepID=UPI0009FE5520|nr:GRP family sugar transporter [Corynebacterium caspium]
MVWILYGLGAAFFAGSTAILAKIGLKNTPASLATALRTVATLAICVLLVLLSGSAFEVFQISARAWIFLSLSGLATGASWLCFFHAIKIGPVGKVAVIDKSSIILTVLLAIFLLGETENLLLRLISIGFIGLGTWLMVEPAPHSSANDDTNQSSRWMFFAIAAAVFAALTAIFGKLGISHIDSSLGTTIRTSVVLVMAWLVAAANKELPLLRQLSATELLFITLSGLATGASWLCFWKAMQDGQASVVVPLDQLSVVITVLAAAIIFGEKHSRRALFGLILVVTGTLLMVFGAL